MAKALILLSVLVFVAGCSNGLNPGERYCVAGREAYYVGSGQSVGETQFLTDNGTTLWVWPDVARNIEECTKGKR